MPTVSAPAPTVSAPTNAPAPSGGGSSPNAPSGGGSSPNAPSGGGSSPNAPSGGGNEGGGGGNDAGDNSQHSSNEWGYVAAGDDTSVPVGVWSTGFGGAAMQGVLKGATGYKSKLYGGAIGVDAKFNENIIAGIAVTYADVNIAQRSVSPGSTKAPTWVTSFYGMYDFGNNWFTRGMLSYSNSHITNKASRPVANNGGVLVYQTAQALYDSNSANLELGGGYRYALNQFISTTPTAALSYGRFVDGGYTETGAGIANQTVNKKATTQLSGMIGTNLAASLHIDDKVVTPEIHVSLRQDISGKAATTVSSFSGSAAPLVSKTKPTNRSYDLGASITMHSGITELGAGIDFQLSKKYIARQGSLKLRLNL